MKPQSIRIFNSLFWLGVSINIIAGFVNGSKSLALANLQFATRTVELSYTVIAIVAIVGIFTAFWFLIVRRASLIARWAFTLFALLMLALNAAKAHVLYEHLGLTGTALEIGRFAVWALAAMLLFSSDADRYFKQTRSYGMIVDD